jgi:hypothetical protein
VLDTQIRFSHIDFQALVPVGNKGQPSAIGGKPRELIIEVVANKTDLVGAI